MNLKMVNEDVVRWRLENPDKFKERKEREFKEWRTRKNKRIGGEWTQERADKWKESPRGKMIAAFHEWLEQGNGAELDRRCVICRKADTTSPIVLSGFVVVYACHKHKHQAYTVAKKVKEWNSTFEPAWEFGQWRTEDAIKDIRKIAYNVTGD